MKKMFVPLLRGIGQIMLQPNAITGTMFLAAVCIGSVLSGIGLILGVVTGTLVARLLDYERDDLEQGLYGYNGALIGTAMFSLFPPGAGIAILTIVGAASSSIVLRFFIRRGFRSFTFSFVLVTWILMSLVSFMNTPIEGDSSEPASMSEQVEEETAEIVIVSRVNDDRRFVLNAILRGSPAGFGQVMFQPSLISGAICLIGLFIAGWKPALFGLAGSIAGVLAGLILGAPFDVLGIGLYGFNGVLCGVACTNIGGATVGRLRLSDSAVAGIAIVVSTIIFHLFRITNLPSLTFPFIAAMWSVYAIRGLGKVE